jgi:hypothetical protein
MTRFLCPYLDAQAELTHEREQQFPIDIRTCFLNIASISLIP